MCACVHALCVCKCVFHVYLCVMCVSAVLDISGFKVLLDPLGLIAIAAGQVSMAAEQVRSSWLGGVSQLQLPDKEVMRFCSGVCQGALDKGLCSDQK